MNELHTLLIDTAKQKGFPLTGVVDIDLAFSIGAVQPYIERYDQWLANGYAGSMEYLVRGRDRRADPRLVFPQAKSILCVAMPYPAQSSTQGENGSPRYARYLTYTDEEGKITDYHTEIAERLNRVMNRVAKQVGPIQWKICVDTSAVLERTWAALAGLGWIGKNGLLIHPKLGSYLFLAEVLIDQNTGSKPAPLANLCGHCSKCLKACPTQAFPEPGTIDSSRCISYLTLEKRGDLVIDELLKKAMGTWIAGCDLCQEACPFNLKPSRQKSAISDELVDRSLPTDWDTLLAETEENYKLRVKSTALNRVKPKDFRRNLAIAHGNALSLQNVSHKEQLAHDPLEETEM